MALPGRRRARPTLVNRVFAGVKREVSTAPLEAFERAGMAVFEIDLLVEQRRDELAAQGRHPWDADGATSSLFLAAWVAGAHQRLGAELLLADRVLDPRTSGFVPAETYEAAWGLFQPVSFWLSVARRAAASPDYWVGEDADLPVALPSVFSRAAGCSKTVKSLLMAGDALDRMLEQSLGAVLAGGPPAAEWQSALHRVGELAAQARAALHYAQALWQPDGDDDLDAIVLRHLQPALVLEHHLGQFLALPELVRSYREPVRPRSGSRRARPESPR